MKASIKDKNRCNFIKNQIKKVGTLSKGCKAVFSEILKIRSVHKHVQVGYVNLANRTGLSKMQVMRCIAILHEKGLLTKKTTRKKKSQTFETNRYIVHLENANIMIRQTMGIYTKKPLQNTLNLKAEPVENPKMLPYIYNNNKEKQYTPGRVDFSFLKFQEGWVDFEKPSLEALKKLKEKVNDSLDKDYSLDYYRDSLMKLAKRDKTQGKGVVHKIELAFKRLVAWAKLEMRTVTAFYKTTRVHYAMKRIAIKAKEALKQKAEFGINLIVKSVKGSFDKKEEFMQNVVKIVQNNNVEGDSVLLSIFSSISTVDLDDGDNRYLSIGLNSSGNMEVIKQRYWQIIDRAANLVGKKRWELKLL